MKPIAPIPSVSVTYAANGRSTKANSMGMRPMQERAYPRTEKRGGPKPEHCPHGLERFGHAHPDAVLQFVAFVRRYCFLSSTKKAIQCLRRTILPPLCAKP